MSSDETSSSTVDSTATPPLKVASTSDNFTDSNVFMFGVGSLAIFVLLVLIFAIYKYRNRDEGTYRIDESKNCGPFAELQMPLNGAAGAAASRSGGQVSGGKKKRGAAASRQNNPNKEWFDAVFLATLICIS